MHVEASVAAVEINHISVLHNLLHTAHGPLKAHSSCGEYICFFRNQVCAAQKGNPFYNSEIDRLI